MLGTQYSERATTRMIYVVAAAPVLGVLAQSFLDKQQRTDGAWTPLWFGNQHLSEEENPLYGTAHVVLALREISEAGREEILPLARRGEAWIAAAQNTDGGWGGIHGAPSTTEETALALEALAHTEHTAHVQRGTAWLLARIEAGTWREPAPIGFYFAKLWYHERLYPLIWTVGALGKIARARTL